MGGLITWEDLFAELMTIHKSTGTAMFLTNYRGQDQSCWRWVNSKEAMGHTWKERHRR
jgi:hypothetical protein